MKLPITLSSIAVGTLLLAATGCGKKDDASTSGIPTQDAAADVAKKATATAQGQTEVVRRTAPDAAAAAQTGAVAATNTAPDAATTAQASAATDKAQGIIDQAKSLLADNKASDALTSLKGLSGVQLTSDQQSAVQSLKDQIQKALAAKATGGLLPAK